jgi:hypothetical protein
MGPSKRGLQFWLQEEGKGIVEMAIATVNDGLLFPILGGLKFPIL